MRQESRKKTAREKVVQGGFMILINIFCLGIAVAVSYGTYQLLEVKVLKACAILY